MSQTSSALWHPCTQMKDHEQVPPLHVKSAQGSILELENGQHVIDALSSWWCKSLGHGHPVLRDALKQQADQLEHCMLGSGTHNAIEQLSLKLTQLMPNLTKVTYASDGACAIEIAMKMSLHARNILGQSRKTKFAALQGAYHGETCGALSVSDMGIFRDPYEVLLTPAYFIRGLPYVHTRQDPLWKDAALQWQHIQQQLDPLTDTLTAIVIEPILQATNYMQLYSADTLKRLRAWCDAHDVHLIADEIMTGLGRTGKMLACEHAAIQPDFICLSKSLTAGWLPMSAVLTTDAIYDLFYGDYRKGNTFMHSHTFAGNPLAARVALANFEVMEQEQLVTRAASMEAFLLERMQHIAVKTGQLNNVRGIGTVVAADLINPQNIPRYGFEIYKRALEHGVLMRPLGNTVYWVLPLNVTRDIVEAIQDVMLRIL